MRFAETLLRRAQPSHIHIAVEGPVGQSVAAAATRLGLAFTTSFHTNWAAYFYRQYRVPQRLIRAYQRIFHSRAARILVATSALRARLLSEGFHGHYGTPEATVVQWSRGVDGEVFYPAPERDVNRSAPRMIYVGRVSSEKDIALFLSLNDVAGERTVVGDGPLASRLRRRFPAARFTGTLARSEVADLLRESDVFVFPSRVDTFGLGALEAIACGVPVAAFPEAARAGFLVDDVNASVADQLSVAVRRALTLNREFVARSVAGYTWAEATSQFLGHLVPVAE